MTDNVYRLIPEQKTLLVNEERRIAPRRETYELAELVLGVEGSPVTCMVHNLSETGAMIETSTRELPKRFVLDNPEQDIHTVCRVVWSCNELTGIEFIGPRNNKS